jgi:hypothetical protein
MEKKIIVKKTKPASEVPALNLMGRSACRWSLGVLEESSKAQLLGSGGFPGQIPVHGHVAGSWRPCQLDRLRRRFA